MSPRRLQQPERIGGTVRRLRTASGMTLTELARRSGVSKAMLSGIERGQKSPTLRTLAQLAEGLGCSVSRLVVDSERPRQRRVRREAPATVVDPQTRVERHLLSTALVPRGIEVVLYVIPPGQSTGEFPPHTPGVVEHITIVRGAVHATIGGTVIDLDERESISFAADKTHEFRNQGAGPCEYLLLIVHP